MIISKCKYCGKIPIIESYEVYDDLKDYYILTCDNALCKNYDLVICDISEIDCIKRWNDTNKCKYGMTDCDNLGECQECNGNKYYRKTWR